MTQISLTYLFSISRRGQQLSTVLEKGERPVQSSCYVFSVLTREINSTLLSISSVFFTWGNKLMCWLPLTSIEMCGVSIQLFFPWLFHTCIQWSVIAFTFHLPLQISQYLHCYAPSHSQIAFLFITSEVLTE